MQQAGASTGMANGEWSVRTDLSLHTTLSLTQRPTRQGDCGTK